MPNHTPSEVAPSAKQLVFLAMMATVVAVIVFLCGVLVGRGTSARRVIAAPAPEVASGAGTIGLGVPEIQAASESTGSPLENLNLSYFDRLSRPDPARQMASPAEAFVVQVTALRSGEEARTVEAGLVDKEYPAFVVEPAPGAPTPVYRVRVGPYATHDEAETVRRRLETDEQFEPFVIQP